jgi:hypothetical protein
MISFGFIFLKNVVHQTVCLLLWNVSSVFWGSFIMKHFLLWNVSSFFFGELHHETFPIVKCKWVHFWATSSWKNPYFNWCWFGHAAIRGWNPYTNESLLVGYSSSLWRFSSFFLWHRKLRVKRTIKVPAISSKLSDIPPDDYSWRKYGQKPIKGSPHPRWATLVSEILEDENWSLWSIADLCM